MFLYQVKFLCVEDFSVFCIVVTFFPFRNTI